MRQLLVIFTISILLIRCEEQKEKIEKFVFDQSKISSREIHSYQFYQNGKIKTDKSISYIYLNGIPLDTTVSIKRHDYDKKGRLIKVVNLVDSSRQFKVYDKIDSLVAEYSINRDGDTTSLRVTDFEKGKIKKILNRKLFTRFNQPVEELTKESLRTYDTIYDLNEHFYIGKALDKIITKNKNGTIKNETHFVYKNDNLIRSDNYSFIGSTKYISSSNHYPNKSGDKDYYSIGPNGDTIAYSKTIFKKGLKIRIGFFSEINSQDISYYNNRGQLIGTVIIDLDEKVRNIYSYTYDPQGNLVEESDYKEKLEIK